MIRFLQIFHAFYIGSWVVTHRAWTIVPHESPSPFTSSLLYCFSTAVPVRCTRLSYPTAIPIFFCPPYPSACFFLHYPFPLGCLRRPTHGTPVGKCLHSRTHKVLYGSSKMCKMRGSSRAESVGAMVGVFGAIKAWFVGSSVAGTTLFLLQNRHA